MERKIIFCIKSLQFTGLHIENLHEKEGLISRRKKNEKINIPR